MPHGHLETISKAFIDELKKINIDAVSDAIICRVESFFEEYEKEHPDLEIEIFISSIRVRHMVKSLYLDMFKYKTFHSYEDYEKPLNGYKKAAFFVKWFIKIKPITATKVGGNRRSVNLSLQVNEAFALVYAMRLAGLADSTISDNSRDRVIYALAYREYNETQFTFWLEALAEKEKLMKERA